MTELLLHYIWQHKLYNAEQLHTTTGLLVKVIKVGTYNTNAGPDFLNAQLIIGDVTLAGNVELHLNTSDYVKHKHQNDAAYNNLILHVVLNNDTDIKLQNIETVELQHIVNANVEAKYQHLMKQNSLLCAAQIANVPQHLFNTYLESLTVERLYNKVAGIQTTLAHNQNNWEQTFFNYLCRALGAPINSDTFELLAQSISVQLLAKHKNNLMQLEALLLGQAGFLTPIATTDSYHAQLIKEYAYLQRLYNLQPLPASTWKYMRLRPAHFPSLRIAQLASIVHQSQHLFSQLIAANNIKQSYALFDIEPSAYWLTHYQLGAPSNLKVKSLGTTTINTIIINTIVPLMFAYGNYGNYDALKDKAYDWLCALKPEKNSIITCFTNAHIQPLDAGQTQALLQLYKTKCTAKQCLSCVVGNYIIKN
jgi:hypothetical protein